MHSLPHCVAMWAHVTSPSCILHRSTHARPLTSTVPCYSKETSLVAVGETEREKDKVTTEYAHIVYCILQKKVHWTTQLNIHTVFIHLLKIPVVGSHCAVVIEVVMVMCSHSKRLLLMKGVPLSVRNARRSHTTDFNGKVAKSLIWKWIKRKMVYLSKGKPLGIQLQTYAVGRTTQRNMTYA